MNNWKEQKCIPTGHRVDNVKTRARIKVSEQTGAVYLVIEEKEPEECDVTQECTVKLIKSSFSEGYYCVIMHHDKKIIALGIDGAGQPYSDNEYRFEKAKNAVMSFRILKTPYRK